MGTQTTGLGTGRSTGRSTDRGPDRGPGQITQPAAPHVTHRLGELAAEFDGWRIGRGGSGHWWAVRGNELIRTLNADELRDRLRAAGLP